MKIQVMPFLSRKGNRVAKAAINFDDFCGCGPCQFVGFTICTSDQGLFVKFPSSLMRAINGEIGKPFFFLRPGNDNFLANLEGKILDVYESMMAINHPHIASK